MWSRIFSNRINVAEYETDRSVFMKRDNEAQEESDKEQQRKEAKLAEVFPLFINNCLRSSHIGSQTRGQTEYYLDYYKSVDCKTIIDALENIYDSKYPHQQELNKYLGNALTPRIIYSRTPQNTRKLYFIEDNRNFHEYDNDDDDFYGY